MKVIEKITRDGDTQIFEVITSRKELAEFFRNELHEYIYSEYAKDWHPDRVFEDENTTVCYYNKDGKFVWISEGETVSRPNIANIEKMMSTNGSTIVIYGNAPVVYNEHYGDWEVKFD
jgi:ATP-dependent protease HslVU (ClpYQ) peptidase subunit